MWSFEPSLGSLWLLLFAENNAFMKNIVFFIVMITLLWACGNSATETPEAPVDDRPLEVQLAEKIKEEMENGERNDTCILDHVFGMSRMDVVRYKNKLVKKKKVYGVYKTKNTRVFVYDLKLPKDGKVRVYFDTFYYEDELYRIECLPKIPKNSTHESVLEQTASLFKKKYGPAHFIIPIEEQETCARHIWVIGNQQIELKCDDKEMMIAYTDSIRELKSLEDL